MEVCDGSVRDIFDYSDDPLYEEEIALIMHESLKVSSTFSCVWWFIRHWLILTVLHWNRE